MENITQLKHVKAGKVVAGITYLCYRTRGDPGVNLVLAAQNAT